MPVKDSEKDTTKKPRKAAAKAPVEKGSDKMALKEGDSPNEIEAAHRLDPVGERADTSRSPMVALGGSVLVVLFMKQFSGQMGPLLLAVILTIAVMPLRAVLIRKGLKPGLASGITLFTAFGTMVAAVLSLVWSGYKIVNYFTDDQNAAGLAERQQQIGDQLQKLGVKEGAVQDAISNIDISTIIGRLGSALSGVLGTASAIGMVMIAMVFMVGDAPKFGDRLNELAPTRPFLNAGLDNFAARTRSYLWVSTVFGAIVAVLDGIALWMMGIPLVFVWVVLSFMTNYIPNIGFIIGVIPPALVALIAFDVNRMIWVIVIYIVLNFVIQTLIQPRFVGDNVGLSTTVTFISLVFWAWVIGPLGAFLAVPLTLLVKALLVDTVPSMQWMRPLLSLTPVSKTEALVPPSELPKDFND